MTARIIPLSIFIFFCFSGYLPAKVEVKKTDNPRRDYRYYISSKINSSKKVRLLIGFPTVTGGNTHIFNMFKSVAEENGWIIVSPNFLPENPAKRPNFRMTEERIIQPALEFIKLVKSDFKKYNLYDKVIVYGFSGGGRDTIGMTMLYPEMVYMAIVQAPGGAHSYWEILPRAGSIKDSARDVPVFFSCGDADSERKSGMEALVKAYKDKFGKDPHLVKYYEKQGHSVSREQIKDTIDFIKKHMDR